jgi:nicotinamide riboside transporter PnuC
VFRLDYLSCVLTVVSTILIGRRNWEGWVLASINSAVFCIIGLRTAQLGFIPANLFCIVLNGINLRAWLKADASSKPVSHQS